ncbi:DsbA family protein, partial [Bacteroidota bacterium]
KKQAHKTKPTEFVIGSSAKIGLAIIVIAVVAVVIFTSQGKTTDTAVSEVVLDMYVMSQCPYGAQAETEAIKAVQKFDSGVDLNIYYIVDSLEGDSFRSLHGQPEVDEDMRQLCIMEEYPELTNDYLLCFNEDYRDAPAQYSKCAQQVGVDVNKIASCVSSDGAQLLKDSEVETKKVGASGSPTIYLNGESYGSGRSEMDFARAICQLFDYEHEGCADIPKPVEVEVTVLTDDDCPSCNTAQIVGVSKQLFPGAKITYVDIDDAEGQKLLETHDLTYLPAYIFESKVEETNTWITNTGIRSAFVESGDGYRIRDEQTGATWFIDEQKQIEYFEAMGITKGDNRPQIDFYVMSYCPYGNQAEEAIAPVFEKLKGKADFNPKYVLYSNYGGGYPSHCLDEDAVVCSMHGIVELNQDIREACVAKYYGTQEWFDFALAMNKQCNSQNADTCWTGVAESLGLNTETIITCEANEGYDLMIADKTTGDALGVSGSPTIFIDGVQYSGSRTANGFLAGLCAAFEDAPAECDDVVAEPTQGAAPQASC